MTDVHPPQVPPQHPEHVSLTPVESESTWPRVVGIIAICLAALELIGGVCGLFAPFISRWAQKMVPQGQVTGMEWLQEGSTWMWLVVVQVLTISTAAVCLIAGVKLVRRRFSAVRWCRMWAVIKIVIVLFSSSVNLFVQQAQFQAMSENPQFGQVFAAGGMMKWMVLIGLLAGLAWGWALPVFMLIWFNRRKIRNETAGWEQPDPDPPPEQPMAAQ